MTKPGECKGKKVTKKLIECLQPDRRVVVEVSGTREYNVSWNYMDTASQSLGVYSKVWLS